MQISFIPYKELYLKASILYINSHEVKGIFEGILLKVVV